MPPDSAQPDVVLDTYLRSLVAGDCDMVRYLATSTFRQGNGDLCGGTDVTDYRIDGQVQPSVDEVVFSTTLTTTGDNESIPAGEMLWFYSLMRQPNGAWRLTGGGTGP